ncbi:MAG: tetratricopeptide repeat protein [Methylophilaceae bacterium]|nr:tetratricopeptide repeat protein [Methylophilaceae bacterium]
MIDVNTLIEDAQKAQSQGNDPLALDYFHQALVRYPNETNLLIACGNLCVKLQHFEKAITHFRHLFSLNPSPQVAQALCYALQSLGNQAAASGRDHVSEACFTEALKYAPSHAIYLYNLGNAQRNLGKLTDAVNSFKQSIASNPDDADVYNNLGNVQRELGQLDFAIANYRKALTINHHLHHSLMHLVHQRQHICDWRGEGEHNLQAQILAIRALVNSNPHAAIAPFAFLALPGTTAAEQKLCANHYVAQHYQSLVKQRHQLLLANKKTVQTRLKIGYLSADFRLHPLAFLITELIENHDRAQFEILAYSYGAEDQTAVRGRLVNAFDAFVDIRGLNDAEAATKINQDGVDILVDLTGYTQSSRTGIAVLKPVPIQINWLGFPGTMGAFSDGTPLFDYILVDEIVGPEDDAFSEKRLLLPCYQPNSRRVLSTITTKNDHHLPDDGFVFCCFNQSFKITPAIFAVWMRLLAKVPNSVLWLLACNPWAKANLEKEAELAGIDQTRLIFAERTASEAHLARQQHADLFLDTLPYNAHTTASDALSAGLPVLTCMGDTFSARVAASLLTHIGLPQLVCHSLIDYENKALEYAQNPILMAALKNDLKDKINQSDLLNAKKFAQSLEHQYLTIWQTHQQTTIN